MPKISVIVPVYNNEQHIRQCLDSLAFQTYADFEAILIDDASLDRSAIICDEYAARNNRFKAFHHEATGGGATARNTGLDHASGQYIVFVDAADYCHLDYLQAMVALMERQQADLATTGLYDEGLLRQMESGEPAALFPRQGLFPTDVMRTGVCCKMFSRNIIAAKGLRFDEELASGAELLFVVSYLQFAAKVAYDNKRTYYRRLVPRQAIASRYKLTEALAREKAIQKLTAACENVKVPTELLAALESESISNSVYIAKQYKKIGQKKTAEEYLRKTEAVAHRLRRDAYAPKLIKMGGQASLLFPRLYAAYRQIFTALLPPFINKGLLSGDRTDRVAYVKGVVLAVLLFFPFIRPVYISYNAPEAVVNMYRVGMVLSLSAAVFLYLVIYQGISRIMATVVLFCLWLFVPTYLYGGSMYNCVLYAWYIIGFCLLTELFVKRDFAVLARSLLTILAVYITINLGTVVFYPEGIFVDYRITGEGSPQWLLGHYNRHAIYILPAVYLALLLSTYKKGKRGIEAWALLVIGAATIFMIWSANSVVAIVMMIVYMLVLYSHASPKWFNIVSYALASIVAFAFIAITVGHPVVMRIYGTLLNRGSTIVGRVNLWGIYMKQIIEKPLLGYGAQDESIRLETIGVRLTAHNTFIEHLYTGGLVGFALLMAVFFMAGMKLYKQRDSQMASVLSFVAFVDFIIQIVETRTDDVFIFQLFIIAYHIGNIIEQQEDYRLLNAQKGKRWVSAG